MNHFISKETFIRIRRKELDLYKPALPFFGETRVEFGFCPEWLGVTPNWEPVDAEKEPFFIYGEWDLPD